MSRRRQFGSIRKLPSGRYQARFRLSDGRLVSAPLTFLTKGDASRWLSTVETDQARGLWIDPAAGQIKLADYAWEWLRAKPRLAARTREIYEVQLRLHVLPAVCDEVPALGDFRLAEISPEVVRAWYVALLQHRSASVAAKAYTRLRQMLGQAVDDDRIAKNPCRIEGGGAERHPEQRFATLPELYELAAAVPQRYRVLVLRAGLTALRQGELFGLRSRDVDLMHGTVAVRRKRLRLSSGEVIEDDPKSEAGKRIVAMPEPLVLEVQNHLAVYPARGLNAYLFTTPEGTPLERSNFRGRIWVPATRTAGMPGLRFHDLRHSAGTLAARTGATTKELMARLGHSSPRAAMIYQHAAEDRDRVIAEGLAGMTAEAGLAPVVPIVEAAGRPRRTRAAQDPA